MKMKVFGGGLREASDGSAKERAGGRLEVSEVRVKRAMVAVDFSEASRKALEYAVVLAKALEAEIILVHVFEWLPGELKILQAKAVAVTLRCSATSRHWGRRNHQAAMVFLDVWAVCADLLSGSVFLSWPLSQVAVDLTMKRSLLAHGRLLRMTPPPHWFSPRITRSA